jgi:hypothetical protein
MSKLQQSLPPRESLGLPPWALTAEEGAAKRRAEHEKQEARAEDEVPY